RRAAPLQDRLVESQPAFVENSPFLDSRSGQLEHPADVRGSDEMPGRAQHVRPQDAAVRERRLDIAIRQMGCAQAESPLRRRVVLRLDGAKPGDDVGWMT